MSKPLTRSGTSSLAVRKITGTSQPPERIRRSVSNPSPSGIITSSRTRSGRDDAAARTAAAPLAAITTSNPASRSDPDNSSRIVGSSSTTSKRAGSVTAFMAPGSNRNLTVRRPCAGSPLQGRYVPAASAVLSRIGAGRVDGELPAAVGVTLPDGGVLGRHLASGRDEHNDGAERVPEAARAGHLVEANGPDGPGGLGSLDGVAPEPLDSRAPLNQLGVLGQQPGVRRVVRGHAGGVT